MAFTRKFLTALGIEADKVDEIITAHTEVTDSLKAERDTYKGKAEKLDDLEKEYEASKKTIEENGNDSYKVKFEALKEDFEAYKKEISEKTTKAKKEDAYKKLLREAGIPEKRLDAILKVSNPSEIEFDEDGETVKNSEEISKQIKEEWADFIPTKSIEGAKPATPPAGTGKATKTKEEIRAISDPIQRQKAMAENPELFGLNFNTQD
jgi:hypothetical protein